MSVSPAERQRAYRERQKARMAEDPQYAAEVKARKAEADHKRYILADKKLLNKKANERYHKRMGSDPDYRQRKRDEAKKYNERHPEKVRARKQAYRESHKVPIAEYMAEWERQNRDIRYALTAKRVYQIASTAVEPIDRDLVWKRDNGICGICHEAVMGKWHLDHIFPLSRGGSHTYDNVQVSHPKCNIIKSDKLLTLGGGSHRNEMLSEHPRIVLEGLSP